MARAIERTVHGFRLPKVTLNMHEKTTLIENLFYDDTEIFEAFLSIKDENRPSFAHRALRIGTIALKDIRTVEKIDYVQKEFDRLKHELDNVFSEQLGHKGLKGELDRIFGENGQLQIALLKFFGDDGKLVRDIFDSANEDTPVGKLRKTIESYFKGEDSEVYRMLDPHKTDSPIFKLRKEIMTQLNSIKADLDTYIGMRKVIEKAPRKGADFEDILENYLQEITKPYGDLPEDVRNELGKSGNKKGDFTIIVSIPGLSESRVKIVVEAKASNQGLSLTRKGIFGYLDSAMRNREAQFAIAVRRDPWSRKVGRYREYETNKILCEFGDDGLAVEVAYRVARVRLLMAQRGEASEADVAAIRAKIEEVRNHLIGIQGIKAKLTSIQDSSEDVKSALDQMRSRILESLGEIEKTLAASP